MKLSKQQSKIFQTEVSSESPGLFAWLVWGLTAIFYFYEFLLQVSPGVMSFDLMRDFHMDATQLGNVSAFYFYAYAPMQIPVGLLLDRFGPRRTLSIAVLFCAIGSMAFGTATHIAVAEFGRLLIGIGSAFAVIGCLKIAANWFPVRRFALITGLTLTIGMLGAIDGEAPLAMLVHAMGWRHTMILLGFIGILLSICLFAVIRDNPKNGTLTQTVEEQLSFTQAIKGVLTKGGNWITAIYGGLMFAPTSAFGALWGVSFLMNDLSISRSAAATLVATTFIGWVFGGPLFGWFSDRIGRRKPPLYISSIGATLFMCAVLYWPNVSTDTMGLFLFLFGFFTSGFLPAFSIIRESNPDNASATVLGFMNALNSVGGAIAQPMIGYLLDLNWHGHMMNAVRVYNIQDYRSALIALPICLGLSLVFLPFVKETFAKSYHQRAQENLAG